MKQQFKDVVVRREDLDVDSAVSHFNSTSRHSIQLLRLNGWPMLQVAGENMLNFNVVRQFSNH
jgi:hypothetical protein